MAVYALQTLNPQLVYLPKKINAFGGVGVLHLPQHRSPVNEREGILSPLTLVQKHFSGFAPSTSTTLPVSCSAAHSSYSATIDNIESGTPTATHYIISYEQPYCAFLLHFQRIFFLALILLLFFSEYYQQRIQSLFYLE